MILANHSLIKRMFMNFERLSTIVEMSELFLSTMLNQMLNSK